MVVATRTDSFVAPTITQLNLYNGIKQAFQNAGFAAPFDDYVSGSGDRILTYEVVLDASKAFGRTYIRIRLTSGLQVNQQIFATWNTANKTGTGGSSEISYTTFTSNVQINFTALSAHPEYGVILAVQGTNAIPLGYFSPANRPNWWNLDAWNYCFIPSTTNFFTWRTTTFNPFNNAEYDTNLNNTRLGNANNQTNRRDILAGILLYTQSNQGIAGRSSDDLVSIAANGASRYDTLQIPGNSQQYLLLSPVSGGLGVRIL